MPFEDQVIETAHAESHGSGEWMVMSDSDGISEELSEKILAFVEREAGQDAPLSPEDEAMVRDLLATDPAARALAEDFRNVDVGLKAMFRAFANMPLPEKLAAFVRDYEALMEEGRAQEAADLLADFSKRKRKG